MTNDQIQQRVLPSPIKYRPLGDAARLGLENPFAGSFADAVDELELLVRKAVQLQSVADVPVGAFLIWRHRFIYRCFDDKFGDNI